MKRTWAVELSERAWFSNQCVESAHPPPAHSDHAVHVRSHEAVNAQYGTHGATSSNQAAQEGGSKAAVAYRFGCNDRSATAWFHTLEVLEFSLWCVDSSGFSHLRSNRPSTFDVTTNDSLSFTMASRSCVTRVCLVPIAHVLDVRGHERPESRGEREPPPAQRDGCSQLSHPNASEGARQKIQNGCVTSKPQEEYQNDPCPPYHNRW